MEKEKFKKILVFNRENAKEIEGDCMLFNRIIGRQNPAVISDIQSLAEIIFIKYEYKLVHICMKSKEIGAFQFKLNDANYLVINTSKSLAYNNFAVAHELYHVLVQKSTRNNSAEVYLDKYEDNPDEMRANAFAGSVLMPREDFVLNANYFLQRNVEDSLAVKYPYFNELSRIFMLMNYYQTTYMSVVIRCYELGILNEDDDALLETLLANNSEDKLRGLFNDIARISGSVSIMEPTRKDDFMKVLYEDAKKKGEKYIKEGFLSEEDKEYRLSGMLAAYNSVKEDDNANR